MTVYVAGGTIVARSNSDSPLTYTTIPQATGITSLGQTRGLIDVTNLLSTAREYKKAIKDGNEITINLQYDPDDATHAALRADVISEDAVGFRVTFPDSPATVVTFDAQVLSFAIEGIEIDNVLMYPVVIKPTGDLTFT
jgi:predicted secreted protein